ncbi:MAG: hydrogenase 4 subunit B [Rhizomicrobium sp.]|nr:hydrogenase 4 subunit B [Rhizomicrobium sp.]
MLLILLCLVALLAVSLLAAFTSAKAWANSAIYGASALLSAAVLAAALLALTSGRVALLVLPIGLPWLGLHLRLDALAAGFLAIVALGGTVSSVYALGYGRHEDAPGRVLPFVPAFLAAMSFVILADDAFAFLLAWEVMSLLSWALVVSHDRSPENLQAGLVYVVMAGVGTLCLMLAFALLAGPGGFAFEAMRSRSFGAGVTAAVLLLALAGAGSKAGLFPLHAWLPLAHPAAPSHVSALMSGIMTKVAVYAFIRIAFDILGPIDWRLGLVVIVVGAATAVLGVLYAILQNDLKRLLAYSTVENVGIIFLGLGLALAFRADGLAAAAALAFTGALFHVFNHALFKSLLFFGAGAIQTATGTRDLDRLGGLINGMPRTAGLFLIGAAAISALPPLNGFASEWLIFQAAFQSSHFSQWGLRLLAPTAAAMLALAAALAAACFVKAFGTAFLGRPRSDAAKQAHETDRASQIAMAALAAGCVLAGVLPSTILAVIAPITQRLTGTTMPIQDLGALLPVAGSHNSYSGLVIALCFLAATLTIALAIHLFAQRGLRRSAIWDCGYPEDNALSQYSSGSFAQPIRRVFASTVAQESVVMPPPGDLAPSRFKLVLWDPAWQTLYAPAAAAVLALADRVNGFQYLTIRRYLGIVFVTLVFLLTVLAVWR